jgi:hypothetical protein
MLCSAVDLSKKFIPQELKKPEMPADIVYRDFTSLLFLCQFRKTLIGSNSSLSDDLKPISRPSDIRIGDRVSIEGVFLLPCQYNEAGSAGKNAYNHMTLASFSSWTQM